MPLCVTIKCSWCKALLRFEDGSLYLFGPGSRGKTTIQREAASVWGRGRADPCSIRSWRATVNALEAAAARVTDTLPALGEIGVAEGMILSFVTTNLLSKFSQPECILTAACGCIW